jgi:hypothetical protein
MVQALSVKMVDSQNQCKKGATVGRVKRTLAARFQPLWRFLLVRRTKYVRPGGLDRDGGDGSGS